VTSYPIHTCVRLPVHPSLVVGGQRSVGPVLLDGADEALQGGEGAGDQRGVVQRRQAGAVLPVVLRHQVVDADGRVAIADVEAAACCSADIYI